MLARSAERLSFVLKQYVWLGPDSLGQAKASPVAQVALYLKVVEVDGLRILNVITVGIHHVILPLQPHRVCFVYVVWALKLLATEVTHYTEDYTLDTPTHS